MDIAILRTAAADACPPRYSQLEYAALVRGARVVTYACLPDTPVQAGATFRGFPLQPTSAVLRMPDVDLLVVPTEATLEVREHLAQTGWGPNRVGWFGEDRGAALAKLAAGRWLLHRESTVVGGALQQRLHACRLQGLGVEDVPPALAPEQRRALTGRLLEACVHARACTPASGPYVVGQNWANFLKATRPRFYEALSSEDGDAMEALLADCFRNELTSGIFGGRDGFEQFAVSEAGAEAGLRSHFNIWRHSVTRADVSRLGWAAVGNPFGVWVDQLLVHPNTMLNDHRASLVRDLVGHLEHPIVAEIGGGYGGFGRQWLMLDGPGTYIDFDLPENLIVASHYLASAHPDKRILLFEDPDAVLDPNVLAAYDVVLLPHFMLPRLASHGIDVFMNFISLSEMCNATIAEYLAQVARVTRGYFYQENLLDSGEGYEFYPMNVFPALPGFRRVFSCPSRWPFFSATSPVHSQGEELFIRSDVDAHRYLQPDSREIPFLQVVS
jgi:putative sugar O-methyltransferase